MARTAQRSTRRIKLMLLLSLLLGAFSFAGYLQAGMLQQPGYRTAAWIYAGFFLLSVVGVVGTIGMLGWRALRRDSERPAI